MPAKDYFYYIDRTGYCSNGNFQLNTIGKPNYAKICAWKSSLSNVVYGCDAKGGICWTSPQACTLSPDTGNSSLGHGLQSCTRPSGSKWCCRDDPVERCGITSTEPFICWANDLDDDNPMRQVEGDVARNPESVRSILSSMGLTISSPTALPIITTDFLTSPVTYTATTTSVEFTRDTTTEPTRLQSKGPVIPTASIAGLVVAALVILGLMILSAVFITRRKRLRSREMELRNTPSGSLPRKSSAIELLETRTKYEVADSTRAELSASHNNQPHELPS